MAKLPKKDKPEPFDKYIDGVFGKFKTSDSYGLYYLMAAIPIDNLDILEPATDALPFEHIEFDELVQRDVDYGRVDDEIIKEYLEQAQNRVVFFPPLLVAPFIIEDGKPTEKYSGFKDSVPENFNDDHEGIYSAVWGENKFKLELPLQGEEGAHKILCKNDGKYYHYLNYAATFKYNSRKVKLVVIDGQHRLVALKRIIERGKKDLISSIELPICVFFPPNPVEESDEGESLIRDMRELFITINTTAKKVSGHFTVLLDDKSLSALCARDLADFWKKKPLEPSQSYLHMLEWNERSNRKARQRNKKYSITTITAIADCLSNYIFKKTNGGLASILLNLFEIKDELRDAGDVGYEAINEDEFTIAQAPLIKKQAEKYITPSLDILFSTPSPYKDIKVQFTSAVSWLDSEVSNNIIGARQFRDDVLFKFRASQQHDQNAVKDIEKEFESKINLKDNNSFYFLNIFQQSLIRAWGRLSKLLIDDYDISPVDTATSLICGLEKLCFSSNVGFFDDKREFTQRVIYRGSRIILNESSRNQLVNLIFSTLLHRGTRTEIVDRVIQFSSADIDKKSLSIILAKQGQIYAREYLDAYAINTKKWLKKDYRYAGYDDNIVNMLDRHKEGEEFNNKIDELTTEKLKISRDILSNMLGIKSQYLLGEKSSRR